MLSKKPTDIKSSEITDKKTYFGRRAFIRAAVLAGSAVGTGLLYRALNPPPPVLLTGDKINGVAPASTKLTAVEEKLTSLEDIANYNNFYEFSTNKQAVADRARNFVSRPWTVTVEGLVHKPKTFDLEELLRFQQEERIYRLRCVEGWSMVIPWVGFPLAELLKRVEPMSSANYVAFETRYDPTRMANQKTSVLPWPYAEGLRLDEALHPLTILATGIYGETLLPQNGAPIRLVVPWKYGFKSIKSIVRIRLVSEQPPTTWNIAAPREYGFYSNVNPKVAHPRWSQARERRIGEYGMRETLFFNGYGDQVAHLYSGLDLRVYF